MVQQSIDSDIGSRPDSFYHIPVCGVTGVVVGGVSGPITFSGFLNFFVHCGATSESCGRECLEQISPATANYCMMLSLFTFAKTPLTARDTDSLCTIIPARARAPVVCVCVRDRETLYGFL